MPQVKSCRVTDTVGSTGKLLNEVYLQPGFASPSRMCLMKGLRCLAEKQNKNPLLGATYSAGLDLRLETCHLQALKVKQIPCCLWVLGPICSSPSPGAAVRERSKWGKVQSLAPSSLALAALLPPAKCDPAAASAELDHRFSSWACLLRCMLLIF